jgi:hypothetical protein
MTRRALVTAAAAAAVVATLVGGAFALQASALRAPSASSLTALRAATWLHRYRLVDSVFRVDGGRPRHATCVQTWFHEQGGNHVGAVMRLDDGFVLLAVPPHTLASRGGTPAERSASPLALLELAGCPRVLARSLETAARDRAVRLGRTRLRLVVGGTRLTITLEAASGRPVALAVSGPRIRGSSRIRYRQLEPGVLRRLLEDLPR